jgi:multiple sugar transport system ATP-binding protein
MTEVVIKNVIKRYGENQAVQGINLEIKDGEFAVLVGPSGCGKSTTLRMIAGLESVTEGDISIFKVAIFDGYTARVVET